MSCVEEVGGPPAKAGFTEGPTGVPYARSSSLKQQNGQDIV
jgi:hypothetical protein